MTHAQTRQTRSCQKNLPKIALRTHSSAVLIRVSTQETITLVRSETNPFPEVMATHLMTASRSPCKKLSPVNLSPGRNDPQRDAPEPTHERSARVTKRPPSTQKPKPKLPLKLFVHSTGNCCNQKRPAICDNGARHLSRELTQHGSRRTNSPLASHRRQLQNRLFLWNSNSFPQLLKFGKSLREIIRTHPAGNIMNRMHLARNRN